MASINNSNRASNKASSSKEEGGEEAEEASINNNNNCSNRASRSKLEMEAEASISSNRASNSKEEGGEGEAEEASIKISSRNNKWDWGTLYSVTISSRVSSNSSSRKSCVLTSKRGPVGKEIAVPFFMLATISSRAFKIKMVLTNNNSQMGATSTKAA